MAQGKGQNCFKPKPAPPPARPCESINFTAERTAVCKNNSKMWKELKQSVLD